MHRVSTLGVAPDEPRSKNIKLYDDIQMDKFQNKYRIPSTRAIWWDYGWNGLYFITICTHNRIHLFGDVVEARLIATPLGEIAETYWHEIPKQFPIAQLGEFVVMPSHIHGIIAIDKPQIMDTPVETRFIASPVHRVSGLCD